MYNNKRITSERLQFIMKYFIEYFFISSNLVNKLMKDENVPLLDIIFRHFKFYDNDYILQLLFCYKNKTVISTSDLNQQISNEKFNINTNFRNNKINKYLMNECYKKDINKHIIKYILKHGTNINNELFYLKLVKVEMRPW